MLRTLMKDARGASFVSRGRLSQRRLELIRHAPRRSNLAHQRWCVTPWKKKCVLLILSGLSVGQAGSLKFSPRISTAQAMRAFLAAIATTAFQ